MRSAFPWLITLLAAIALLAITRCDARDQALKDARLAAQDSTIAVERRAHAAELARLRQDSVARVAAVETATRDRARAAAEKARADSLRALVTILSDSTAIVGRDTVAVPKPVLAELRQLRITVDVQARALTSDGLAMAALELELASARRALATGEHLVAALDTKVAILEEKDAWWKRFGRFAKKGAVPAGCGALGALVSGPAGAAIGAGGCAYLIR